MRILERLFGPKAPPPSTATPQDLALTCTSCGKATSMQEAYVATAMALLNEEELRAAFDYLPWVDANGQEVRSSFLDQDPAAELPIATPTAIVRANLNLRNSPVLGQLGLPVGDASGIPLWSTAHVVGLLKRLEIMGYASFRSDAGGWSWPVACPRCQDLRLTGRQQLPRYTSALRDAVPPRLRFQVMQRDGFRCVYCGRTAAEGARLHVDHVIPVTAGGPNEQDNLVTACEECNLGKGAGELP
jgi:5-methylcytosine-specific restriction endonuclease McrA